MILRIKNELEHFMCQEGKTYKSSGLASAAAAAAASHPSESPRCPSSGFTAAGPETLKLSQTSALR